MNLINNVDPLENTNYKLGGAGIVAEFLIMNIQISLILYKFSLKIFKGNFFALI